MRRSIALLALLLLVCGAASAEKQKISVAFSYGAFYPSSSATKDRFGDSFTRIGFTTFDPSRPTEWRFIMEAGDYKLDGPTSIRMMPLTFGMERGIGNRPSLQPYVTLRAGPYYGKVKEEITGLSDTHVGLNVNATLGVVLKRRFYAEVRYDYFSRFADTSLSGISLAVGIRLFDIRL
jgi:hypothetical protein